MSTAAQTVPEYLVDAAIMQLATARVFTGRRHHLIIHDMVTNHGFPRVGAGFEQGFVTNTGRFLSRADARKVALAAGQVKEAELHNVDHLFSEEVWP